MGAKKIRGLVLGYVEGISSKIFESYSKQIAELAGDKQGVYALYKGKRLYYVGLATNLKARVNQHLKDKHKGKWDKFSLYLVRKTQHIKELESLILRIADPKGNAVKGKLPGAENYQQDLRNKIKQANDEAVMALFGGGRIKPLRTGRSGRSKAARSDQGPTLAPYFNKRSPLRAWHRGKEYKAWVTKTGEVIYNRKRYNSPSTAGKVAIGRNLNGWYFWRFKNADGEWVRLRELRRGKH